MIELYLELQSIEELRLLLLRGLLFQEFLAIELPSTVIFHHFLITFRCCSQYVLPSALHVGLNEFQLIGVDSLPFPLRREL
jgi:hypothetical protein